MNFTHLDETSKTAPAEPAVIANWASQNKIYRTSAVM